MCTGDIASQCNLSEAHGTPGPDPSMIWPHADQGILTMFGATFWLLKPCTDTK